MARRSAESCDEGWLRELWIVAHLIAAVCVVSSAQAQDHSLGEQQGPTAVLELEAGGHPSRERPVAGAALTLSLLPSEHFSIGGTGTLALDGTSGVAAGAGNARLFASYRARYARAGHEVRGAVSAGLMSADLTDDVHELLLMRSWRQLWMFFPFYHVGFQVEYEGEAALGSRWAIRPELGLGLLVPGGLGYGEAAIGPAWSVTPWLELASAVQAVVVVGGGPGDDSFQSSLSVSAKASAGAGEFALRAHINLDNPGGFAADRPVWGLWFITTARF